MSVKSKHRFQVGKYGSLHHNILAPKIENLVIEGAGTRGPVGAGAIDTLEQRGVLAGVKQVAGSSAGASIATLLAIGYKAKEIKEYVDNFNFNELKDIAPPKVSSKPKKFMHLVYNVFSKKHGVYKGKKLLEEIRKLIQDKIQRILSQHQDKKMIRILKECGLITDFKMGRIKLNSKITFKHLQVLAKHYSHLGFKNLSITGTNTTTKRLEIFNVDNEPEMEIALAVRISMSIPWVFKQVKYKNNFYMDGGCLNNFPMEIFDHKSSPYQGEKGQNLCTLGIKIDKKNEMIDVFWQRPKPSQALLKKLGRSIFSAAKNKLVGVRYVQASEQSSEDTYQKYSQRVIQGYDEDVSFADFNLDDHKKKKLYESGKRAAKEWLDIHEGEVLKRERFQTLGKMSDEVLKECHYQLRNPEQAKMMFHLLGKTQTEIDQSLTDLLQQANDKLSHRNLSPFVLFHQKKKEIKFHPRKKCNNANSG